MPPLLLLLLPLLVAQALADNNAIAYNRYFHPHNSRVPHARQGLQLNERGSSKYIRPCYFTNWAQYRPGQGKFVPEDYEPGLCTHILFAFGWMNEDFTVKAFDPADLKTSWAEGMYDRVNALKRRDPDLRTLLSIGGWTFGTRLFKAMAATPEGRKTFIDSSMVFVRAHGFDGLDIDWEYPAGDEDKGRYSLLIRETRTAFEAEAKRTNRPRLLLSAAVSAGEATIKNAYDIPSIAQDFDFILLMCYDFHGAWESGTGMNSPLFAREGEIFWQKVWNIDWAADYWYKNGMPKDKIIIGIPTYGRGWTLKDPESNGLGAETSGPAAKTKYTREPGVASYYEFCEMFDNGAVREWDAEHQVPYLVYKDQWFSYDDEQSIRNKMGWLKSKGFGGAFVWTLDFDDFKGVCQGGKKYPLISVIRDELSGSIIEPPPHISTLPPTTMRPTTPVPVTTDAPISTVPPIPSGACAMGENGFRIIRRRVDHPFERMDCGKFLLCLDGVAHLMACPDGLEFGTHRGYCYLDTDSECHQGPTPAPVTTTTPATTIALTTTLPLTTATPSTPAPGAFTCTKTGFFASAYCCNKFYRCVDFGAGEIRAYPFSCPAPLHFDQAMLVCVHPSASKCDQSSVPGGQKCD